MQLITYTKRPILYAGLITFGFALLLEIVRTFSLEVYLLGCAILYLIILFEIYSTKYYAEHLLKQLNLEQPDEREKFLHLVHHLFLPSLLFLSLVLYIASHNFLTYSFLFLTGVFIIFSVLFTNIKAFYENKHKLEDKTVSIYDVITLIIFFLLNLSVFSVLTNAAAQTSLLVLVFIAIFILVGTLTLLRYRYINRKSLILSFVTIIVAGLFGFGLIFPLVGYFGLSLFVTVSYYIFLALITHQADNTLNAKVVSEYLLLLILFVIFLITGII